ncbi:DNA-binding FadR family transcriptional regulator [Kribbella aluminosa]|uniref:DNA-binding FadR family transcriptional regulator n=1 Tax=Kribbella aluminosa TaxID=416017 RepID=A0ABS4UFY1_9ACTN|nr:FCD domain-containing protein [Kribbella aluminosa]MBP2350515.1 DNA-binding FadR family transcriptional regulator [Kribbella aluminosa]
MSGSPLFVRAQEQLKSYIREHRLEPGDRLPSEGELAKCFSVSRGAMREATRSLQTLGVIRAHHGNGLYVADFSFRPIVDLLPYGLAADTSFVEILQAREALETGLMPAVALRTSPQLLDGCDEIVRRMDEREKAGDSIVDLDRNFHLLLHTSLSNPLIDNLISLFWELYWRLEDELSPKPTDVPSAPLHAAIVDALRVGDAMLAMTRMQEHFADVRLRSESLHASRVESRNE